MVEADERTEASVADERPSPPADAFRPLAGGRNAEGADALAADDRAGLRGIGGITAAVVALLGVITAAGASLA